MELIGDLLNDVLVNYFNLIVLLIFTQFIRVATKAMKRADESGATKYYTATELVMYKRLKHWCSATGDYITNHRYEMKTRGLGAFGKYLKRSLRREMSLEMSDRITSHLENRILTKLHKKEGLQLGNVVSPFGTEYGKKSVSFTFRF